MKQMVSALFGIGAIVLATSMASAVVIVDMNFDGATGLENAGVGPAGVLEGTASIGSTAGVGGTGGLLMDGTEDSGLRLDIGALGPFSGAGDFSLSFDFKANVAELESGMLFNTDPFTFIEENGLEPPDGQEAALTVGLFGEEVGFDLWFFGGGGIEGPFNDGNFHTVNIEYDAAEKLFTLSSPSSGDVAEVFLDEEDFPFAVNGRDTANDLTWLGNNTNFDLGEDETGLPCNCTFDNLFIEGPSPPPVKIVVDRNSGDIDLEVIAGDPVTIDSIGLESGSGTLVADNYNGLGAAGGVFADWAVDSADEFEILESGTEATIANTDGPYDLGDALWMAFFDEDLRVFVNDTGLGGETSGISEYIGDPKLFGDLDEDDDVDADDFGLFRDGFGTNVEGLSFFEAYFLADLNGDEIHNFEDWGLFAGAFDDFNGEGAFAALLAVPEPATLGMLVLGAATALTMRRRKVLLAAAVLALAGTVGIDSAQAVVEVEYLFDSNNFDDTSGNGRTGVPLPDVLFGPIAQNQQLRLTGGFEEGLQAPVPTNTLDGRSSYTIELDINTTGNSFFPEAGVIVASSSVGFQNLETDPDPTDGANQSMSIFIEPQFEIEDDEGNPTGEFEGGALVLDYFFVGEVRVDEALLLDGANHSLIVSYQAPEDLGPEDDPNPGTAFLNIDGEWLAVGELTPRPEADHTLVQFGNTANSEFPFECFEGECFTSEFEGMMDNIRIKTGDDTVIPTLLRAEADGTTGEVTLMGGEFAREIRYIETNSESGSINDGQWNSLSDQNLDPVDGGAELGETWEELNASRTQLAEAFLLGTSEFSESSNSSVSLGTIYNPVREAEDLEIIVTLPDGEPVFLEVDYVNPTLIGDFDGNDVVEAADLDKWQQDYGANAGSDQSGDGISSGQDFLGWQTNLGATASSGAASAVPEPSSAAILLVLGCGAMFGRSKSLGSR